MAAILVSSCKFCRSDYAIQMKMQLMILSMNLLLIQTSLNPLMFPETLHTELPRHLNFLTRTTNAKGLRGDESGDEPYAFANYQPQVCTCLYYIIYNFKTSPLWCTLITRPYTADVDLPGRERVSSTHDAWNLGFMSLLWILFCTQDTMKYKGCPAFNSA